MNRSLKKDMDNARIKPTGKVQTKKVITVPGLAKPRITSDRSQGPIVSDSFTGTNGFDQGLPPIGRYIFIKEVGGLYVDSKNGAGYMTCDTSSPGLYNAFLVLDLGNNWVNLMAGNGKYVTRQDAEGTPMICNRDQSAGWQKFGWIDNGDGTFSLQGDNGLFVSSENGAAPMTCNRSAIGGWEKFQFDLLPDDYKFDWLFNTAPSAPSPSTPVQATEATLPVPEPMPVTPLAEAPAADPGTTPTPTTTTTTTTTPATTQQSFLSGGKYWWLWYVVAAIVVIAYIKFSKR